MEFVRKPGLPAAVVLLFILSTLVALPANSGGLDGLVLSPQPLPGLDARDTIFPMVWIVSTSPADGETDVNVNAPIVIVFSGPIDTANLSVTIIPALVLTFTWSSGDTVLNISHPTPFFECTAYTFSIGGVDPGPVPNPWTFFTTCGPPSPFEAGGNLTIHRR